MKCFKVFVGGSLIKTDHYEVKIIDIVDDKKKTNNESREKELDYYQNHRDFFVQEEINRLKNNMNGTIVVTDFDCGPCARCRVKDRSLCDDGYNCQKKHLRRNK